MSKTYIVKRHGSNAANQSMQLVKVVGTVTAEDYDSALKKALNIYDCYNNQHLELIDLDGRTRKADRETAFDADAARKAMESNDPEAWNAYLSSRN